jgi:hypothetical protein
MIPGSDEDEGKETHLTMGEMNAYCVFGKAGGRVVAALACTVILSVLLCAAGEARGAQERILSFASQIIVSPDASMLVTETLRVRSSGDQIKRGIYRDFPTRYKDRHGNAYVVGFEIHEVLRDGAPEAYHTEGLTNGVRVYIGRKDYMLPPGEYTYTLTYRTDRQLGFFSNHDELYWNVTGNGWVFPIDEASAVVVLPRGVPREAITLDGYTGLMGGKGKHFRASVEEDGSAFFVSTKGLGSYEGLTIVVGWPKGFVTEPPRGKRMWYFVKDNVIVLAGTGGLVLLVLYYLSVWFSVGRDPERGTIVPLYKPPDSLSPAATRFITRMGYDEKIFSAAVVNMAVKGFLTIAEHDGEYTLKKKPGSTAVLSADEQQVAAKLFGAATTVVLEQKNHTVLRGAKEALQTALTSAYEKSYFVRNRREFIIGVLISVAALAAVFFSAQHAGAALFLGLWLTGWSIGVGFLIFTVVRLWKAVFSGWGAGAMRKGALGGALFMTLFSVPFFGGELFGLYGLAQESPVVVLFLGAVVFVNLLFYHLLKAPTMLGRRLLDRIEGFKTFLSATEGDRLVRMYPAERTPELFERFLPYALALDVEQPWSEQFSDILQKASREGREGYSPSWYSGSAWNSGRMSSFGSAIGSSLAGAISSSSTAPGSSSGGGGGGSSGGGGGGGGGGGW